MRVVSNSSCIIALSRIGRLHILKDLFGSVLITDEVFKEISFPERNGAMEVLRSDFLKVRRISNYNLFELLNEFVDEGEASAIV